MCFFLLGSALSGTLSAWCVVFSSCYLVTCSLLLRAIADVLGMLRCRHCVGPMSHGCLGTSDVVLVMRPFAGWSRIWWHSLSCRPGTLMVALLVSASFACCVVCCFIAFLSGLVSLCECIVAPFYFCGHILGASLCWVGVFIWRWL